VIPEYGEEDPIEFSSLRTFHCRATNIYHDRRIGEVNYYYTLETREIQAQIILLLKNAKEIFRRCWVQRGQIVGHFVEYSRINNVFKQSTVFKHTSGRRRSSCLRPAQLGSAIVIFIVLPLSRDPLTFNLCSAELPSCQRRLGGDCEPYFVLRRSTCVFLVSIDMSEPIFPDDTCVSLEQIHPTRWILRDCTVRESFTSATVVYIRASYDNKRKLRRYSDGRLPVFLTALRHVTSSGY